MITGHIKHFIQIFHLHRVDSGIRIVDFLYIGMVYNMV